MEKLGASPGATMATISRLVLCGKQNGMQPGSHLVPARVGNATLFGLTLALVVPAGLAIVPSLLPPVAYQAAMWALWLSLIGLASAGA